MQKSQQLPYKLIYSLNLTNFKMLKTYNNINLANSFIWSSNLFIAAFIFFIQKSDKSLYLYVNYWDFNNLTIKNQYLLPLINKLLN